MAPTFQGVAAPTHWTDSGSRRPMNDARHALEITRAMHRIGASPEGQTLTLTELERAAEEERAVEREERAEI